MIIDKGSSIVITSINRAMEDDCGKAESLTRLGLIYALWPCIYKATRGQFDKPEELTKHIQEVVEAHNAEPEDVYKVIKATCMYYNGQFEHLLMVAAEDIICGLKQKLVNQLHKRTKEVEKVRKRLKALESKSYEYRPKVRPTSTQGYHNIFSR